jgi:hypothetical protein
MRTRTTQKRLRALMRAARTHLGVRTNAEVWTHVASLDTAARAATGTTVMVTPHRYGSWGVYSLHGSGAGLREHHADIPVTALSDVGQIIAATGWQAQTNPAPLPSDLTRM